MKKFNFKKFKIENLIFDNILFKNEFSKILKEQKCYEPMEFIDEIKILLNLKSKELKKSHVDFIVKTFIRQDSIKEINISYKLKKKVMENIDDLELSIENLKNIERYVKNDLISAKLPEFKRSDSYKDLMKNFEIKI